MSEPTTTYGEPTAWTDYATPERPALDTIPGRLARDGFVHLPHWLEPAVVQRTRDDILAVLDRIGWLPGAASETSVVAKLGRQEGSEGWWAGYRQVQSLERFHRLGQLPPMQQLYAAFFPTSFVHPRKWGHLIYPQFAVPAHQDFPAVQGAVDTLTIWIPTYAAEGDHGRLQVVPGSHRSGVRPMVQLPQAGVSLAEEPTTWTDLPTVPGDVVVMHSLLVHQVTPNRSAEIDVSAEYRVQDARDPVSPASLIPHHYPRIPSARVLSQGWRSKRWIRRPLLTRTQRFRMPPSVETWHTVLDASGSRLLATGEGA